MTKFEKWYNNLDNYNKKLFTDQVESIKESDDCLQNTEVIPVIDCSGENLPVLYDSKRNTIIAFNEGGYCCTEIDAETLYIWLKQKYEK